MISDNLVQLASYSFPHEAHVAKASLEAAGIPAFLADEHTISMQWLYSNALGGVRLLVRKEDEAAALEILETDYSELVDEVQDEARPGEDEEREETHCPRCGSNQVEPTTAGKKPAFLAWASLGIPLFFIRHGMKCRACGKLFRD